MNDKPRFLNFPEETPWFQLLITICVVLGIGSVLMILLTLAGSAVFGEDLSVLNGSSTLFDVKDISFLRYLLVVQDISILIIPSLIILKLSDRQLGIKSAGWQLPSLRDAGLAVLMTFCLFPVTSFTGELNSALHLPSWLSGIENWMIGKEKTADNLIDSLISSGSMGMLFLNIVTIALLPAIAEELIFRGVLQKIFGRMFRSFHAGIWITSFIFSTVHFQFFGFVPRFILGLAFGYLYYWGGTLWLPMIAHFINNAFPVVLTFFQGKGALSTPTDTALWKQAIAIPVPLVIIFLVLFYFRNKKMANPDSSGPLISRH